MKCYLKFFIAILSWRKEGNPLIYNKSGLKHIKSGNTLKNTLINFY